MLTLAAYEALGGLEGGPLRPGRRGLRGARRGTTADHRGPVSPPEHADDRRPRYPAADHAGEVARVAEVAAEAVLAVRRRLPPSRPLLPHASLPQDIRPETILDISHESLIRHWGRLRAWVEDEAGVGRHLPPARPDRPALVRGPAPACGAPPTSTRPWWKEEARPNVAWAARYGGDFDGPSGSSTRARNVSRKRTEERHEAERAVEQEPPRLAEAARSAAEVAEERAARGRRPRQRHQKSSVGGS